MSTFPAQWIIPIGKDVVLGGAEARSVVLRPNLALINRLWLSPSDLQQAQLLVKLQPPKPNEAISLAGALATDGQQIEFAAQPGLQSFDLRDGERVALAVWRHQWHYDGGGEASALRVTRMSDDKSVALPAFVDRPSVTTELGTFRLAGLSKRGKLPIVEKQVDAVRGEKSGEWTIAEGRGISMRSSEDGNIRFHTQGQSQAGDAFDFAPAIVFEPASPGAYTLSGQLSIRSGQAADKNQAEPMSWTVLAIGGKAAAPSPAVLQVHRLLRAYDVASVQRPVAGEDYDAQPLATAAIDPKSKEVRLDGFAPLLSRVASGDLEDHGLLLTVANAPGAAAGQRLARYTLPAAGVNGELSMRAHPTYQLFTNPQWPTAGVYTVVQDGHLSYEGKRLRLWGVAGGVGDGNYERAAQRLARLGFNAIRLWGPGGQGQKGSPTYDAASTLKGELRDTSTLKPGERNNLDEYDRYIAACKAQGLFIMCPQLQNGMGRELLAQDGSFVAGGDDWADWKAAIVNTEAKGHTFWKALDERLIKAQRQHAVNFLTRVNPYTGVRYADEESIAIWEIHNEHFLIRQVLDNGIDTWPKYFQDKLTARWNGWLKTRYADDAALRAAWGELADGESLAGASVAPAPAFPRRTKYPKARAEEFVTFISEFITNYYKDYEAFCRSLGTPGKGVAVVPFSYDTQFRPNIPWNYSAGAQADVNNFGMYFWNTTPSLDAPPSTYVMDSLTIAGKPTVIYETNSARPNPYRTERPFMNAALAGWQDWDAMFYHYYHSKPWIDEQFLATDLQYMSPGFYWSAVEIERDPTMLSAIALAGRAFINGYVAPAPDPVTYEIGKKGITGYDLWNGLSIGRATFQRGAGLRYLPNGDFGVRERGATADTFQGRVTEAVRSGEQITWDWPNGRLIIDAPQVKAYVGRPPADGGWYRFSDGLSVGAFTNDFVSFAAVSADGKPLVGPDPAQRIFINARRDATNTGFDMDRSVARPGGGHTDPVEQAKAIRTLGRAPIVEDRVPYVLAFPTNVTARFTGYDAIMRRIDDRAIEGGNEVRSDGLPLFMGMLEITARGATVETPQSTPASRSPVAVAEDSNRNAGSNRDAAVSKVWHPIASLHWSDSYSAAHQAVRNSTMIMTTISPEDRSDAAAKTILLTEAEALFNLPANLEIAFADDKMQSVIATFSRPPAMADVLEAYSERFGKPTEQKLADVGYASSKVVWTSTADDTRLTVTVMETQGTMTIAFRLAR
ncbi:MAG TPA: hypothetical protein VGN72_18110 [Tepidisphaeraceae bacterium]|nr:hypothetical protein [Tepidisphaeraceae bacterium]